MMLGFEYIVFQEMYGDEIYTIGEIGAYLSGIFAPVAWYCFYVTYKRQQEALRKQAKRLS